MSRMSHAFVLRQQIHVQNTKTHDGTCSASPVVISTFKWLCNDRRKPCTSSKSFVETVCCTLPQRQRKIVWKEHCAQVAQDHPVEVCDTHRVSSDRYRKSACSAETLSNKELGQHSDVIWLCRATNTLFFSWCFEIMPAILRDCKMDSQWSRALRAP